MYSIFLFHPIIATTRTLGFTTKILFSLELLLHLTYARKIVSPFQEIFVNIFLKGAKYVMIIDTILCLGLDQYFLFLKFFSTVTFSKPVKALFKKFCPKVNLCLWGWSWADTGVGLKDPCGTLPTQYIL